MSRKSSSGSKEEQTKLNSLPGAMIYQISRSFSNPKNVVRMASASRSLRSMVATKTNKHVNYINSFVAQLNNSAWSVSKVNKTMYGLEFSEKFNFINTDKQYDVSIKVKVYDVWTGKYRIGIDWGDYESLKKDVQEYSITTDSGKNHIYISDKEYNPIQLSEQEIAIVKILINVVWTNFTTRYIKALKDIKLKINN